METAGLKLAMAQNQETLKNDLSEIVRSMRKAHKNSAIREYLEMDSAFHYAFFANCGNKHLHDSYNLFSGKIAALRTHLATKPGHTKLSLDEHLLMLEIVKSGDAKKGESVLVEHIGRTRDAYSLSRPQIKRMKRQRDDQIINISKIFFYTSKTAWTLR
jgi:DNA-binding GntR family transcriptional regulator